MNTTQLSFDFTNTKRNGHNGKANGRARPTGAWSRIRDPLSRDEECKFLVKAQAGCLQSRNLLVEHNLGFIHREAWKFHLRNKHIDKGEFLSAGCEGFIVAIDRFDASKGFKLFSYAVHWMHQQMRLVVEQDRLIRLPHNATETMKKVSRGEMEGDERTRNFENLQSVQSLDAPVTTDTGEEADLYTVMKSNVMDALTRMRFQRMHEDIEIAILTLSDKQRKIIRDYYGLESGWDMTMEAIGKEMGYTREYIRIVRNQGLERLARQKHLKKYLRLFS